MERPNEYNLAAISLLISGVFNLWIGAILVLSLIWMCCGVIWVIPTLVGVVEIVTAARMLSGHRVHSVVPVAGLGLLASTVNFNVIGIACEVIVLAMASSAPVARWLEADPTGPGEDW